MGYSNGKITAPVGIGDIQNAIGVSGGGNIGTLCKSSNINMWAKYKPVQNNKADTTDEWDFTNNKWKSTATWWKGLSNSNIGGITPKEITTTLTEAHMQTVIGYYNGTTNGWVYDKPQGGVNQPYRYTDFADYNHRAAPPIQGIVYPEKTKNDGKLKVSGMYSPQGYDNITLSDFSSRQFGSLYFGVLLAQGTSPKLIATSETAGVAQIERNFSGSGNILALGTYKMYPILCDKSLFTSSWNSTQVHIYTCPMCEIGETKIVDGNTAKDVIILFTPNLSTGTSGTFQIQNNEGNQLTGLKYKITSSSSDPDASTMTNWPSSQTVSAGGTSTLMTASFSQNSYFHILFNMGGGTYRNSINVGQLTPVTPDR